MAKVDVAVKIWRSWGSLQRVQDVTTKYHIWVKLMKPQRLSNIKWPIKINTPQSKSIYVIFLKTGTISQGTFIDLNIERKTSKTKSFSVLKHWLCYYKVFQSQHCFYKHTCKLEVISNIQQSLIFQYQPENFKFMFKFETELYKNI